MVLENGIFIYIYIYQFFGFDNFKDCVIMKQLHFEFAGCQAVTEY